LNQFLLQQLYKKDRFMLVSVEISYYPLVNNFSSPVNTFLDKIQKEDVKLEIGNMSSVITGEYLKVMKILTDIMGDLMEKFPSVFTIKLSNTCEIKY